MQFKKLGSYLSSASASYELEIGHATPATYVTKVILVDESMYNDNQHAELSFVNDVIFVIDTFHDR